MKELYTRKNNKKILILLIIEYISNYDMKYDNEKNDIRKFNFPSTRLSYIVDYVFSNSVNKVIDIFCKNKFLNKVGSQKNKTGKYIGNKKIIDSNGERIVKNYVNIYSNINHRKIINLITEYYTLFPDKDIFEWNKGRVICYKNLKKYIANLDKKKNISNRHDRKIHEYYNTLLTNINKNYPIEYQYEYTDFNKGRMINHLESTKSNSDERYSIISNILNCKKEDIVEYDINGSIYRLSYNLEYNTQLSQNEDIYKYLFDKLITASKDLGNNIETPLYFNSIERQKFKKILMSSYMRGHIYSYVKLLFDSYTNPKNSNTIESQIFCNMIKYKGIGWDSYTNEDLDYFINPEKYGKDAISDYQKDRIKRAISLAKYINNLKMFLRITGFCIKEKELTSDKIYNFLKLLNQILIDIFKYNKHGKYIFFYESDLHIIMIKKFLDLGIKTINVYDGFYFDKTKVSKELFFTIYEEATKELKDYIENYNTPIIQKRLKSLKNKIIKTVGFNKYIKYKGKDIKLDIQNNFKDINNNLIDTRLTLT